MTRGAALPDVAIVGLGPAGRALAHRCSARGLSVIAVDRFPGRTWTATYAAWADELPHWLDPSVFTGRVTNPAVRTTTTTRQLARTYVIFDTALLQSMLDIGKVEIRAGRAIDLTSSTVTMDDGSRIHARRVVDARGTGNDRNLARQTAYGIEVDTETAAAALAGNAAWFMDWSRDNGTEPGARPSFLYAMPVGVDRVLLEETCLVGRPPLPVEELRVRLEARMSHRGVPLPRDAKVERVDFVVEPPMVRYRKNGPIMFGSRGGLIHPGTGYSVAGALAYADPVAEALAAGGNPETVLWPRSARIVARLRRTGLRVLLELEPEHMPAFFEAFFDATIEHQRAYLSSRTDPRRTLATMGTVFRNTTPAVRRTILRTVFGQYRR